MNKKRIRQMAGSLLRRVTAQPAVKYLAPCRSLLVFDGAYGTRRPR